MDALEFCCVTRLKTQYTWIWMHVFKFLRFTCTNFNNFAFATLVGHWWIFRGGWRISSWAHRKIDSLDWVKIR